MEGRRSILLVDDNVVNRQILFKILSDEYDILQAEDGQEALEILKLHGGQVSAVLLDLVMPVMDGYEFLIEQQKFSEIRSIPVIATTQKEGEETEVKALSMGAYDFLAKPYKPAIIKHRLANTIRLRETASAMNTVEHDRLTGLYNKEFFYQKSELILNSNSGKLFDMVCVDIEHFKLVNDLFGTEEGDNLLKYLANDLKERASNIGISGRIGPDTFVTLLPHRTDYCKEMFAEVTSSLNEYPMNINIVLRFGIYEIDDTTIPVNVMCDRAKLAIESIKGKYEVYFSYYDQSIRNKMLLERTIVDNMKEALTKNQFQIYYQPKYDLSTEKIIGAEALVRWQHPENGFMTPDEFIPLFEKNGFITDLDMYVWEGACKEIYNIRKLGIDPLPISVNVSRVDIYNPSLTDMLMDLVKKYDIEPKYLHLEITESAYTENPRQLIDVVQTLKNVGFVIEMDDFGTGYSSLNMLNELPIDMLKLDMRFLQNKININDNNIISFIISLAKWMNLEVVAEGVETREQVTMLQNMDCNYAQGYYYARPMPQIDYEKLLMLRSQEHYLEQRIPVLHAKVMNKKLKINTSKEQQKTMLIADDMETNRAILVEIFSDEYDIAQAENGEQAIRYLASHATEVGIVLLDLLMPVMDGFQALEYMKNNVILKNIPVIITSQAGEGSEARALSLGAADFIGKPYNPDVAIRRVNNVMADVNLRKFESEQELKKTLYDMQRIIDKIPVGIATYKIYTNGELELIYCNEGFCNMLGYSYEEYVNLETKACGIKLICEEDEDKFAHETYCATQENRNIDVSFSVKHKKGVIIEIHVTGIQIQQDEDGRIYHCVITNTAAEHRMLAQARKATERDEATGLFNRISLEEKVFKYFKIDSDSPAVFIMLKITGLAKLSESAGQVQTDLILQKIAYKLKRNFCQADVIARISKDKFAIFMPGFFECTELRKRLSRLCISINLELTSDGNNAGALATMGVCTAPMDGSDFKMLYDNAYKAIKRIPKEKTDRCSLFSSGAELPDYPINQNIKWMLDETSDLVFVCDADNYDILYLNKSAAEISGKEKKEGIGQKCYKLMWGIDYPCTHCNFFQVNDNELHKKEVIPQGSDTSYTLKGKRLDWNGKNAMLQFVHKNVPNARENAKQMDFSYEDSILVQCVEKIFNKQDIKSGISDVLESLMEYYGATRSYVFIRNDKTEIARKIASFERNVKIGQKFAVKVDISMYPMLKKSFDERSTVFINGIEQIKESSPAEYKFCTKAGVYNSYWTCLRACDGFTICVGVYNAGVNIKETMLLQKVSQLIKSEVEKLVLKGEF